MVRVASLKSQVEGGISKRSQDGKSPEEQLVEIRNYLDKIEDKILFAYTLKKGHWLYLVINALLIQFFQ